MNVTITLEDLQNMQKTMKVCEEQGFPVLHFIVNDGEISMVLQPIVIGSAAE